MNVYQILCLIGVPSFIGAIWAYVATLGKQVKAIKAGLQALLRAQMISDYNKWSEKHYAPIYARENFENLWIQYEALGADGVLLDIRTKFLSLPTERV